MRISWYCKTPHTSAVFHETCFSWESSTKGRMNQREELAMSAAISPPIGATYVIPRFQSASEGPRRVAVAIILKQGSVTSCYVLHSYYLRTRLACFTRFSMTPSNASLSSNALALLFSQYSSTSLALVVNSSSLFTCARSSLSVMFDNAASVVAHNIFVACRSKSGGEGGPFLFRDALVVEG